MSKVNLKAMPRVLTSIITVIIAFMYTNATENYLTRQRFICPMAVNFSKFEESTNKENTFQNLNQYIRFFTQVSEVEDAMNKYKEALKNNFNSKIMGDNKDEHINILYIYLTSDFKIYHRGNKVNDISFDIEFAKSMINYSFQDFEFQNSNFSENITDIKENKNSCFDTENYISIPLAHVDNRKKNKYVTNNPYLICSRVEKHINEEKIRIVNYPNIGTAIKLLDLTLESHNELSNKSNGTQKSKQSSSNNNRPIHSLHLSKKGESNNSIENSSNISRNKSTKTEPNYNGTSIKNSITNKSTKNDDKSSFQNLSIKGTSMKLLPRPNKSLKEKKESFASKEEMLNTQSVPISKSSKTSVFKKGSNKSENNLSSTNSLEISNSILQHDDNLNTSIGLNMCTIFVTLISTSHKESVSIDLRSLNLSQTNFKHSSSHNKSVNNKSAKYRNSADKITNNSSVNIGSYGNQFGSVISDNEVQATSNHVSSNNYEPSLNSVGSSIKSKDFTKNSIKHSIKSENQTSKINSLKNQSLNSLVERTKSGSLNLSKSSNREGDISKKSEKI